MRPKGKSAVDRDLARKWLVLHEEYGASIPQIARSQGYDARTVRKYLTTLLEEREEREARQSFLRGTLEKHHDALCSLAESLRDEISGRTPCLVSSTLRENPLYEALQQHIPRWSLWKDIERLEKLTEPFNSALQSVRNRVRREATEKSRLKFVPSRGDSTGLLEGWVDSVVFHLQSTADGGYGLKGVEYSEKEIEAGILIQRGAYPIVLVNQIQVSKIEKLHGEILDKSAFWAESIVLFKQVEDFLKVQGDIKQQLTKIILRRVLPGRCIYCPF